MALYPLSYYVSNRAVKSTPASTYPALANVPPEDADYPASNLLRPDRYTLWKCPASPTGDVTIDIDLGANVSIGTVGVLNLIKADGGIDPMFMAWYYGTTYGSWTNLATGISLLGGRDVISAYTPVSARYWRVVFDRYADGVFTLGKLFLGSAPATLGSIIMSPGSTRTTILQRVRNRTVSGVPVVSTTGPNRYRWDYQFLRVGQTTRDSLYQLAVYAPLLIVDTYNTAMEVDVIEDSFVESVVFGPTPVFDVSLSLEQLP